MKKGLVFDLDGVIADTAPLHYTAWKKIAEEIGITIDLEFNNQLKGITRMESLEKILQHGGKELEFTKSQKQQLTERKNDEYLKLLENLNSDCLLPGVEGFLIKAKHYDIPCAIASASQNARMIIEKLGISHYFEGIVDPQKLSNGKPDPEIFIRASEMLKIKPTEAIGFEDSEAGIEGINEAGMLSVGITGSAPLPKAKIKVRSLNELSFEALLNR